MVSGNHFAESTVLALAHAYEQATEWHKRRPATPKLLAEAGPPLT
jgi:aspartyl-tRNA(Asn)/glutamyl-tRNA(Gln) amidotransferase subunit A